MRNFPGDLRDVTRAEARFGLFECARLVRGQQPLPDISAPVVARRGAHVVKVSGAIGSGKSRLLREFSVSVGLGNEAETVCRRSARSAYKT